MAAAGTASLAGSCSVTAEDTDDWLYKRFIVQTAASWWQPVSDAICCFPQSAPAIPSNSKHYCLRILCVKLTVHWTPEIETADLSQSYAGLNLTQFQIECYYV